MTTKQTTTNKAEGNPWGTMTILLAAIFMTLLDVSIVNVALPSIQHGLQASGSSLEWIVSGYTLAFGLLLIPAGRIGDNIGHRKTFMFGLTLFTLASLICAVAQNPAEIVASRFIQGLGAGIYTPSIVAFIQLLFQGRARSKAFSLFGAVVGVATAVGPLLGGILVNVGGSDFGWRLVFLVNIPVAMIVVPIAYMRLPLGQSVRQHHHKLDPVGIGAVAVGLLLLLFPLVEGRQYDWAWWTWACFAASALVFVGLWQWEKRLERRGREPLLAIHVLKQPAFALGAATGLVYFAAFTSIFFILSLLWQEGFGRDALATGLMMSPFALGNLLSSSQSFRLSGRLGYKVLMLGSALVSISLILVLVVLHAGGADFSAWLLAGPLLLGGLGSGSFIAPNQDFALSNVPHHDAGSASGMFNTAQRVGTSFGIAAVGTVFFSNIHVGPGRDIAAAFIYAGEQALRLNIILVLLTFVLAAALWGYMARKSAVADAVVPGSRP